MKIPLICYASRDGQTARIAERIAHRLENRGIAARRHDLTLHPHGLQTDATMLEDASAIMVIAAVRYGRHLREAERFLQQHRGILGRKSLAVASVNLSARKSGHHTAEHNVYLGKWLARHELKPMLAIAFAGRLDYPRYRWYDRMMIRMIMKMSGGPTDPDAVIEYTDWAAVDAFGDDFSARLGKDQRPRM
ncbi:protoporphyrinogen oxidase [Jeongeupia sp. HS-3]|uniref:menaquinone-dependent protoporphyrinogen IX dehydrogenase n=1 Tax=Jeongeupia sp. HS-3 TaxID=1009682 RepID=UPI0018A57B9D|nr:menaquinone-dependent protoporphyrinogen IX dehydrogenase [Jeongeupia sp. HS-3]BCL74582.1 protoporphyrinogen oxidase [Jeongeupia sp. HS-3]